MSVQATGKIRNYQILMASMIFLNFPLAYIVLKVGLPVYAVWIVRIMVNIFVMTARCIYMKKKLEFPLLLYVRKVIVPIISVTIIALPVPLLLYYIVEDFWLNMIIVGLSTLVVTIFDVYFIGMNANEKDMVYNMILSKIPILKSKF